MQKNKNTTIDWIIKELIAAHVQQPYSKIIEDAMRGSGTTASPQELVLALVKTRAIEKKELKITDNYIEFKDIYPVDPERLGMGQCLCLPFNIPTHFDQAEECDCLAHDLPHKHCELCSHIIKLYAKHKTIPGEDLVGS